MDRRYAAVHRARLEQKGLTCPRSDAPYSTFLRHALRDGHFHADSIREICSSTTRPPGRVDFGIMGDCNEGAAVLAEILYGFITRNYLHTRSAFRGRLCAGAAFGRSLRSGRAIGEPIHNRTAEDISMAKLLMLLFEVTDLLTCVRDPNCCCKNHGGGRGVARGLDPKLACGRCPAVVREWIERHLGRPGRSKDIAQGAGEVEGSSAACRR